MSPIVGKNSVETASTDVQKITDDCFKPHHWFVKFTDFDPEHDKYMAVSLNYRGNVRAKDASATVQWLKKSGKIALVEWCPTGFKIGLNEIPAAVLEEDDIGAFSMNTVMIANNTGISRVFSVRISRKYDLLYSQRAFVHWYMICLGL
ncbi:tubA [Reticulomyxa filosa]|uniref:TubA n=1 Tax=Reticulomyxa filosa TaxID=46433 RepID=X6NTZ5_RETFI|nr:tubA [Reticulomyxa filosa]|eukprot:ETO29393.1 tubA [Reticulomyxa filosa]